MLNPKALEQKIKDYEPIQLATSCETNWNATNLQYYI